MDTLTTISPTTCEGRLTLESGVPVSSDDQSAKTTLYFSPYKGNVIDLYSGSYWVRRVFTERSLPLSGLTASLPYDIFGYDNSGTVTLEALAWTNATTRATVLTTQDGVLAKSGTTTRRYLGTVYVNSSGGQTDDTVGRRYLWNYYNRVARPMQVLESTNSWTYTTQTWRQANGAAGNQLDFVIGVLEDSVDAEVLTAAKNSSSGLNVNVAVGLDSTSTPSTACIRPKTHVPAANLPFNVVARWRGFPGVGRHTLVWLEISDAAGATTWYGDDGGADVTSGITGLVIG